MAPWSRVMTSNNEHSCPISAITNPQNQNVFFRVSMCVVACGGRLEKNDDDDDDMSKEDDGDHDYYGPCRKRPRSEKWSVEWTSPTVAVVRARQKASSSPTWLSLQGQCQATCLQVSTSSLNHSNEEKKPRLHGYALSLNETVKVHAPEWTSWMRLDLPAGSVVQLASTIAEEESETKQQLPEEKQPLTEEGASSFQLYALDDAKARPTVLPEDWKTAVNDIVCDYQEYKVERSQVEPAIFSAKPLDDDDDDDPDKDDKVHPGFCIALCGSKSVGKSTCLRYVANRLLEWTDQVAILDADVGQPEFSPPSVVALTLVGRPLLQPPHANLKHSQAQQQSRRTVLMHLYGSVTSQTDPARYLECLASLVEEYQSTVLLGEQKDARSIPLLVNLDGWVKGFGQHVLEAVLQETLHARHVIQLRGSSKAQAFTLPPLKYAKIHVCVPYHETAHPDEKGGSLSLTPATSTPALDHRSLRLVSYFLQDSIDWNRIGFGQGGIDDPDCLIAHALASQHPYAVPMEAVQCLFCTQEDAFDIQREEMVWKALNGAIVGLCINDDNHTDAGSYMPQPSHLPCVGLGIVRAIDPRRRLYYLLTPIPHEHLQSVNCLVRGRLQLPMECLFRGWHAEPSAYLAAQPPSTVVGAEPMKSRNNLARK